MGEVRNGADYLDRLRQLAFYRCLFFCAFVLSDKAAMPDFRVFLCSNRAWQGQKAIVHRIKGVFVVTAKIAFLIPPCIASVNFAALRTPNSRKRWTYYETLSARYMEATSVRGGVVTGYLCIECATGARAHHWTHLRVNRLRAAPSRTTIWGIMRRSPQR